MVFLSTLKKDAESQYLTFKKNQIMKSINLQTLKKILKIQGKEEMNIFNRDFQYRSENQLSASKSTLANSTLTNFESTQLKKIAIANLNQTIFYKIGHSMTELKFSNFKYAKVCIYRLAKSTIRERNGFPQLIRLVVLQQKSPLNSIEMGFLES